MIVFIICARCISMKVNNFFTLISICFPNPLIIQVSNIPNFYRVAPKSVPGKFSKFNHIQLISNKLVTEVQETVSCSMSLEFNFIPQSFEILARDTYPATYPALYAHFTL
jgi:hypothetical protein